MRGSQFWTLFYYGSAESVCSKHKSFAAALRAVGKCEARGGADHRIVEVAEVLPYERVEPKRGKR